MNCSADWTIKLWDDRRTACVFSWDLNNAVVDVAWAPFSSTVFACVTANATVHVFDIAQNKLEWYQHQDEKTQRSMQKAFEKARKEKAVKTIKFSCAGHIKRIAICT